MKNRSLKVSLVRDDPTQPAGAAPAPIDPEAINEIVINGVNHVAITVGVIILSKKAADTLSELILIAGRKYI